MSENPPASKLPINWKALILLLILLGMMYWRNSRLPQVGNAGEVSSTEEQIRSALLSQALVFSKHGRCRMDCRMIDLDEVRSTLQQGQINWEKSEPQPARADHCPSYAFEGRSEDGQMLRVVYGLCDRETLIITAIDLENEYDCDCE